MRSSRTGRTWAPHRHSAVSAHKETLSPLTSASRVADDLRDIGMLGSVRGSPPGSLSHHARSTANSAECEECVPVCRALRDWIVFTRMNWNLLTHEGKLAGAFNEDA